ncbi:MAG: tRNA lysidine(34) synthetase TilS [Solirubrobacteraceae bacterium]
MSDLLERVRGGGLLAAGQPVLVLLSGGRDSTCLLDVALRIAGQDAVQALHVNYGLREAAAADEAHCRELCRALDIPLRVIGPARPQTGNVQAWAREERYAAAAGLAEELGADVATGHTATDQVETILYRLASSPSRRALLGMSPRDGRLIRPLLGFSREETAAHCRERGLGWREDESNQSDAYARARIRGRLVPALREIHPAAEENVLAVSAILRAEAAVLDALVDEALGDRHEIELAALRDLPTALQRLVVQRLADDAAGGPAPGTARRVEELTALGRNAALDLPGGVRAVIRDGMLRFTRTPPLAASRESKKHRRTQRGARVRP